MASIVGAVVALASSLCENASKKLNVCPLLVSCIVGCCGLEAGYVTTGAPEYRERGEGELTGILGSLVFVPLSWNECIVWSPAVVVLSRKSVLSEFVRPQPLF